MVTLKVDQEDASLVVSVVALSGRHAKFVIPQITILNPQRVVLPSGIGSYLCLESGFTLSQANGRAEYCCL